MCNRNILVTEWNIQNSRQFANFEYIPIIAVMTDFFQRNSKSVIIQRDQLVDFDMIFQQRKSSVEFKKKVSFFSYHSDSQADMVYIPLVKPFLGNAIHNHFFAISFRTIKFMAEKKMYSGVTD